jgi:hypothetical protein
VPEIQNDVPGAVRLICLACDGRDFTPQRLDGLSRNQSAAQIQDRNPFHFTLL